MKEFIAKKSAGFYFLVIAVVLEIISLIRFLVWAGAHSGMDLLIVGGFVAGIILGLVLVFYDNAILMVLMTAGFSIAGIRLLTDSVGSFVDAFQGINMFGDATQVGNIISMIVMIMIGVLACMIASFLNRAK
ncbi:MAG TPA: hypothetical protein H9955_05455 [Candidatus Mediterraneibacter cottocaccae]|nr:hypothetical protein [Candidatus Mediterraneibacter cottocaccae]